jgi:hypothetical protein
MNRSDPQKRLLDWIEENAWWAMLFGLPGAGAVLAHLANWSAVELIGLMAVLFGAALAAMALLFWRRVRLAQADAALKQAMLEQGLSPDDIERLLTCPSAPPHPPQTEEEAIEDLAACLRQSAISETVMAQVFTAVRAAEPPLRLPICHAIRGLAGESGDEADEKQILAAVRSFCGSDSPPAETALSPAGEQSGSSPA